MKNTKPIEKFADLVYYNENLKTKGLPQYEITNLSVVEGKINITNGSDKVILDLTETMLKFMTKPEYCFVNVNKLSRVDLQLVNALLYPKYFQKILRTLVSNLMLMDIHEIEWGKSLYSYNMTKDKITLTLKLYKGKEEILYLPSCVDKIDRSVFENKKAPRKVISYSKNLEIGARAFSNSRGLEEIITPNGIKSLGMFSFNCCTSLRHIELNDNITEIPDFSFSDCCELRYIKLPNDVKVIKKYAFANTKVGENADIFSNCKKLETIEESAFDGCGFKVIKLNNCISLKSILNFAFDNNTNTKLFDISNTKIKQINLVEVAGAPCEEISYPNTFEENYADILYDLQHTSHIRQGSFLMQRSRLILNNYPKVVIKETMEDMGEDILSISKEELLAKFVVKLYEDLNEDLLEFSVNGMSINDALKISGGEISHEKH